MLYSTELENTIIVAVLFSAYKFIVFCSVQFSSVAQSCPTLCDPMNRGTPGLPVHHQLPEITQSRVHRVSDAIQPSHPLLSPSPPAPNPSNQRLLLVIVNEYTEIEWSLRRWHPVSQWIKSNNTHAVYWCSFPFIPSCTAFQSPGLFGFLGTHEVYFYVRAFVLTPLSPTSRVLHVL